MVFGRKKEASDEARAAGHRNPPLPAVDGQFRQPTDMAWDRRATSIISDGYINSRVAKYDKNGDWVKSWGEPRHASPASSNTPHSIAADAQGNIYVADRGNRRIQVFDGDGKFLREITIDVPVACRRAAGDRQSDADAERGRQDAASGRALGGLHHARARTRCCMRPTRFPAASTS